MISSIAVEKNIRDWFITSATSAPWSPYSNANKPVITNEIRLFIMLAVIKSLISLRPLIIASRKIFSTYKTKNIESQINI